MADLIVQSADPIGLVGGCQVAPEILNILLTHTKILIAADGGADQVDAMGAVPAAVIGDMDSISPKTRQKFAQYLVAVAEQESTDLEKVVTRVAAPVLVGAGFLGGRLDHSFAALNVMARYANVPLILVSDIDCCFRCPDAGLRVSLPIGTAFSVLPMAPLRARSSGLVWNLDDLALDPVGVVSACNKTASPEVTVSVDGPAIITVPLKHLPEAMTAVRRPHV